MGFLTIVVDDETLTYDVPGTESAIKYKRFSQGKFRDIEAKCRRRSANRQGVKYWETDEDKLNEMVLDYTIVEIVNVKHPVTGEFVKTDLDMKLSLPLEVVDEVLKLSGAAKIMEGQKETDPPKKKA